MKNKEIYNKTKQVLLNISEEVLGYKSGWYEILTKFELYEEINSYIEVKDEEMEEIVDYAYDIYMNSENISIHNIANTIYELIEYEKITVKEICQLSKADFIDEICF